MSERRVLGLIVRLLVYYAILVGVAVLLPRTPQWLMIRSSAPAVAALATLSALALIVPAAWVYMRTKPRARYDPSLVHTLIILPVVIAGVVLIVRDSIALAFSLAGIVAAVRFRNTLRDTKDAVYIFLAIAVGLAAGVHAFSVGLVVSVVYIAVVLGLWRFDVGTASLDPVRGRLVAQTTSAAAQAAIATLLEEHALRWKLVASTPTALTFAVHLRRNSNPDALVDAVRRDDAARVTSVQFELL